MMTGLLSVGRVPCYRAIACLQKWLVYHVATPIRARHLPFFFMPLAGAVSVAGGASIMTDSDMVVVVFAKAWESALALTSRPGRRKKS